VLQCVAVCCRHDVTHSYVCDIICVKERECVCLRAVGVLQCVAVCCSALQCVADMM